MSGRFLLPIFLLLTPLGYAQIPSKFIHYDQFGYAPNATKVAVMSNSQIGFNAGDSYVATAELYEPGNGTFELLNGKGEILAVKKASHKVAMDLDLQSFGAGVYFLKYTSGEEFETKKIVLR